LDKTLGIQLAADLLLRGLVADVPDALVELFATIDAAT
jgi:hypothetical protein